MGRQHRAPRTTALLLAASCTAEPVADLGDLSVGTDTAAQTTAAADTTTLADVDASADTNATASVDDAESGSSAGVDDGDDGPVLDVGSPDDPIGCASTAEQYIYLLDVDGGLHSYDPATGDLESLGTPVCEGAFGSAALTIDRDGLLWALMVSEEGYRLVYTIDPATLDCTMTDFADPDGYTSGGLAFVADAPDSEEESLYIGLVAALDFTEPFVLGRVDLATMAVDVVGDLPLVDNGYYQIADLTGTGDARMFGFFPGDDAVIAEIGAEDATLVLQQPLSFGVGSPWAFAQWGGRLWLFSPGDAGSSQITAYDLGTDAVEEIDPALGISVVGAAVSTCAPYQPEG